MTGSECQITPWDPERDRKKMVIYFGATNMQDEVEHLRPETSPIIPFTQSSQSDI